MHKKKLMTCNVLCVRISMISLFALDKAQKSNLNYEAHSYIKEP